METGFMDMSLIGVSSSNTRKRGMVITLAGYNWEVGGGGGNGVVFTYN